MSTEAEMPLYRCHKIVAALKIGACHPDPEDVANGPMRIIPADARYGPFMAVRQWTQRFNPKDGDLGYFVKYEGGYTSWSPTKEFEDGYTAIDDEPNPGPSRESLIRDAVRFVLSHYAAIEGKHPFQVTDIDPDLWWAKMMLRPTPSLLPRSREHHEAYIARWQALACEHLTNGTSR